MLEPKLDKIYKEFLRNKPGAYIIPEPPRGNTIRLYSKLTFPAFTLVGDNTISWKSLPKKIDLTKNYWEKTPISTEHLWVIPFVDLHGRPNSTLYLINEEDNKYFSTCKEAVWVGVALFAEDTHDVEQLACARERGQERLNYFRTQYEDALFKGLAGLEPLPVMPKGRRGRPKGSKNKPKEQANESK